MAAKKSTKTSAKKRKARTKSQPPNEHLYTGMSGQLAAMSEFLWRGYNTAIPSVDVGDDIFVVEASEGTLRRVQVKTGTGAPKKGTKTVQFALSRSQLRGQRGSSALFFMLLTRWDDIDPKRTWRFLLMRRETLDQLRVLASPSKRAGRPPVADEKAKTDALTMAVTFSEHDAEAWGHSLTPYLDTWSDEWPESSAVSRRATPAAAGPPAPTPSTVGPGKKSAPAP